MGVLESIAAGARASIEVVPPSRGGDIEEIMAAVRLIATHQIAFVSVTDHPGGRAWVEGERSVEEVALRTKPGTLGTAVALREAFRLVTVPHIVASGADRLSIEDLLIDLHYAGFRDLFVVRGDEHSLPPRPGSEADARRRAPAYAHAADLVAHVASMNRGFYTPPAGGRPTDFHVGVAGYPEKHFEAPNLAVDLARLKAKVEAGADYIVTQMVFDAAPYARFVAELRAIGVKVPVIPGIKPLLKASSVTNIPRSFHVDIPEALVSAFEDARTPAQEKAIGLDWAVKLCRELLDAGAPILHFFTMGSGAGTKAVLDALYGASALS